MVTNICSMQKPFSGFLCWYTTVHKYFCNFYPSIQLTLFRILIQKGFVLWSNTMSQSFQWYRPFSIPCLLSFHFLKKCFPNVGIFMRIVWYYSIIRSGQKWSGKCLVHRLMDTIPRTKTIPLRKISHFFVQCIIAKTCDYPSCYFCHLGRHLKYFTTLKNNNNMPVKFSKYNRKLSENSY